jgi:hypothetical protein
MKPIPPVVFMHGGSGRGGSGGNGFVPLFHKFIGCFFRVEQLQDGKRPNRVGLFSETENALKMKQLTLTRNICADVGDTVQHPAAFDSSNGLVLGCRLTNGPCFCGQRLLLFALTQKVLKLTERRIAHEYLIARIGRRSV